MVRRLLGPAGNARPVWGLARNGFARLGCSSPTRRVASVGQGKSGEAIWYVTHDHQARTWPGGHLVARRRACVCPTSSALATESCTHDLSMGPRLLATPSFTLEWAVAKHVQKARTGSEGFRSSGTCRTAELMLSTSWPGRGQRLNYSCSCVVVVVVVLMLWPANEKKNQVMSLSARVQQRRIGHLRM